MTQNQKWRPDVCVFPPVDRGSGLTEGAGDVAGWFQTSPAYTQVSRYQTELFTCTHTRWRSNSSWCRRALRQVAGAAQQYVKWSHGCSRACCFACQPSGAGGPGARSGSRCQWRRVQTPAAETAGTRKALVNTSMLTGSPRRHTVATATHSLWDFSPGRRRPQFLRGIFLIAPWGKLLTGLVFVFFLSSMFRAENPDSPTAAFLNLHTPPTFEANYPPAAAHLGSLKRLLRHKHTHAGAGFYGIPMYIFYIQIWFNRYYPSVNE